MGSSNKEKRKRWVAARYYGGKEQDYLKEAGFSPEWVSEHRYLAQRYKDYVELEIGKEWTDNDYINVATGFLKTRTDIHENVSDFRPIERNNVLKLLAFALLAEAVRGNDVDIE